MLILVDLKKDNLFLRSFIICIRTTIQNSLYASMCNMHQLLYNFKFGKIKVPGGRQGGTIWEMVFLIEYIDKFFKEHLLKFYLTRKAQICVETSLGKLDLRFLHSLSLGVGWGHNQVKFYIKTYGHNFLKIFPKTKLPENLKLVQKHLH